jgi:hypothetical protein
MPYILAFLSLSLLLLVPASFDFQWTAAYIWPHLTGIDSNNPYSQVVFDDITGLFEGNPLNLPNPFEHTVEIDADQMFQNETLKHEMISKSGPIEFSIPILKYNLLGFNISATDIEVNANAKQLNGDSSHNKKTRYDFQVMQAGNVNVSNGITNYSFNNMDLSSIYAIYDPATDKFTYHIPFEIAAKYLLKNRALH